MKELVREWLSQKQTFRGEESGNNIETTRNGRSGTDKDVRGKVWKHYKDQSYQKHGLTSCFIVLGITLSIIGLLIISGSEFDVWLMKCIYVAKKVVLGGNLPTNSIFGLESQIHITRWDGERQIFGIGYLAKMAVRKRGKWDLVSRDCDNEWRNERAETVCIESDTKGIS